MKIRHVLGNKVKDALLKKIYVNFTLLQNFCFNLSFLIYVKFQVNVKYVNVSLRLYLDINLKFSNLIFKVANETKRSLVVVYSFESIQLAKTYCFESLHKHFTMKIKGLIKLIIVVNWKLQVYCKYWGALLITRRWFRSFSYFVPP